PTLTEGCQAPMQIWGAYDSGPSSQIFVPPNARITFSSTDTTIANVDANRTLHFIKAGSATIACNYLGFHATASVTVVPSRLPATVSNVLGVSTRGEIG